MSATDHPFGRNRIATVAGERGVDDGELDDALSRVQRAIARGDATYEYSSQHQYAWRGDDAYYLYGDGIWETLRERLSLSEEVATAARAVHRRAMLEAATERDERDAVAGTFDDGSDPLVVTDTSEDPSLFGQDV